MCRVWLRVAIVALMATGCAEPTYDPTSNALDGVRSELKMIDLAIERGADFSYYQRWNMMPEDPGVNVAFEGGQWIFAIDTGTASFAFRSAEGDVQQSPDHSTDQMEVTVSAELDTGMFFGEPGQSPVTASSSTVTRALTTSEPAIGAAHSLEQDIEHDGVRLDLRAMVDAEVRLVGSCAIGEVSGQVTASGETPDEDLGTRTIEFEAHYEGRELVWRAFDDDITLEEGRLFTVAAAGC